MDVFVAPCAAGGNMRRNAHHNAVVPVNLGWQLKKKKDPFILRFVVCTAELCFQK